MKKSIQLFLLSTVLGLFFVANSAYGQHIPVEPAPPDGSGFNNGGSKSPVVLPLEVYYNSTTTVLEFVAEDDITFSYAVFDSDETLVCQGTLILETNESHLLNMSALPADTYTLRILYNNVSFVGTFEI